MLIKCKFGIEFTGPCAEVEITENTDELLIDLFIHSFMLSLWGMDSSPPRRMRVFKNDLFEL